MRFMNKNKYQTLFRVTQRDSGSIASSPCPAIFADRRVHIPITLIVFIIYVLFKIKLYLLLFERFACMCLFSMFVNYHTCCAKEFSLAFWWCFTCSIDGLSYSYVRIIVLAVEMRLNRKPIIDIVKTWYFE